ncbi:hypothetical protein PENTCL1PPCAC_21226, partial [Pristionchus entomophagus]
NETQDSFVPLILNLLAVETINHTPKMRLCLLLSLPTLALSCIAGYDSVFDGQCLKTINKWNSHAGAKEACEDDDSHLPFIRSQEDNAQFHPANSDGAWLGLSCNGAKFVWDDGTVANFTNFKANQVCDETQKNTVYWVAPDGTWNVGETTTRYPICQRDTRSWICDTYYLLQQGKSDDICYLFDTKNTLLPDAEATCENQLAFISPIHDQAMNDYVKRTAVGYGLMGGVHIGLKSVNDKYIWSDGSEADFLNFAPGFPDPSFGECLAMGTGLFPGKWMNIDCDTPLPYMCSKPALTYDESVAPAGCSDDGEFYPGDEIYSPTWGSATGPSYCDYAVMDLDKSKKVTVEILLFESNSCCDTLTIYDGLFGTNVLKKFTGYYGITSIVVTGTTNAIRMEWNAKSGEHVRGWHARVGSV